MIMTPFHKVMYPLLPPHALHRKALVEELIQAVNGSSGQVDNTVEDTNYRTILLCAPAGYGKTTLLADFARNVGLPCCWYFLDTTDEDVIVFLQMLLSSIRKYFPTFGPDLEAQLNNIAAFENHEYVLHSLETFIETFARTIAGDIPERFVLIFCNYHEINPTKTTNALINRLLQNIPPQCTLLFESRSTPALDFTSLLARGQILSIKRNKLRFSAEEICELARLHQVTLTTQEAQYLEQSFEGWIAGILLGTHLGNTLIPLVPYQPHSSNHVFTEKPGSAYLFTYLAQRVFAHQSEAYWFLKETAIFHQMTPALCNDLLAISDAASRLLYLEEQGLFVTQYRHDVENIFMCHPVLRELLYDELKLTNPQHLVELHIRAVELFRHTNPPEAIAHALVARAFDSAAQLIETTFAQQFAQGYLITIAQWIDALPAEITKEYPRLLLIRANIFLEASELTHAQPLLEQALATLQKTQVASSLQAEILLAQAKLLLQQGQYHQAQSLCKQALTLLSDDEIDLCALAHQLLGSCAAYLNNFTDCVVELQQALQLYQYHTRTHQVAKIHTLLANSYGVTGHVALSEHHRTRAIQHWESIHDEWGKIDNIIGLGAIKERQGERAEAERLFMQALDSSRGTLHYGCGEAYALANLGDLYQNRAAFHEALAAFEDSLVLSRQLNESYLTHYILCQMAKTYHLLGDAHSARHIMSQLEPDMLPLDLTATLTYEQALYALTLGIILLHTGKTTEAYPLLEAAELAFAETRYEQIMAMVQVAACLFAQGKRQAALQHSKQTLQLAEKYHYKELLQIELKRCPDLQGYLKSSLPGLPQTLILQEDLADTSISVETLSPMLAPLYRQKSILSIQALGTPAIYKDRKLIGRWRTTRSMELFFLLLNASYPLSREQLITDLWHNEQEPTDQVWRSTLYYLRQALGTECVTSHNGAYTLQLEVKYDFSYDVADFFAYAKQALEAQTRGDQKIAIQALEAMADLYKGDFLHSFHNNWCLARRNELRQTCIDVHNQLALIAWQQRQADKSIYHWQKVLKMDNISEIAYEGLIRCYLYQGKRHLALQQYNQCAMLLQTEMNIVPGQKLQALYQHILESSPST
jgi:LuxR family transcriptional regulator, maltose regulon positive regulatory protein